METKEITIQVPEGKRAEWVNGVLTLVDEVDNRPVTERIKTFEDACRELGESHQLVEEYNDVSSVFKGKYVETFGDITAYLKLRIVAAALNEGWEPKFTNDEFRYYPWFDFYTKEEVDEMDEKKHEEIGLWWCGGASANGSIWGLASASSYDAWSDSSAHTSARLAVKSEELAIYFGRQFIEIWKDYCYTEPTLN